MVMALKFWVTFLLGTGF